MVIEFCVIILNLMDWFIFLDVVVKIFSFIDFRNFIVERLMISVVGLLVIILLMVFLSVVVVIKLILLLMLSMVILLWLVIVMVIELGVDNGDFFV